MTTSFWEEIMIAARALSWVEVVAVMTGIIYVVLAARENIWCWFWGIISSGLSIYLFIQAKLYAESMLYFYYVVAGIYGWWMWSRQDASNTQILDAKSESRQLAISVWPLVYHLGWIVVGSILALLLAWGLNTFIADARLPVLDAFTTIFSFIATYMVARKVLENWIYWIIIDAVSVWMYQSRDLLLYAVLMAVYTVVATVGYFTWRRQYRQQRMPTV